MGQLVNDVEEILNNKEEKKAAKTERQKILADMKKVNAEKQNLIKKVLASQRAKFGAGGTDDGMSTDAVLKRLENETSEPYEEKLREANAKLRKIKAPKSNLLKSLLGQFENLL